MPDQLIKPESNRKKIEVLMDRAYISPTSVLVIDKGNQKFLLSDGHRSILGHASIILKVLRSLNDRCGYEAFWPAFRGVPGIKHISSKKIVI